MMSAAMVYASIGAVLWLVMDRLGIIADTFDARKPASGTAMVLASLMVILLWWWFVVRWFKGMWSKR